MNRKLTGLCTVAIFISLLSACNPQPTPTSIGVTVISPTQGSIYPAPQNPDSPYPGPAGTSDAGPSTPEAQVQTPVSVDPNNGSVEGVLKVLVDGNSTPVSTQILYLAPILADDQGVERIAALDRQNSPKTITGSSGSFTFENVQPGHYGLILDIVVDSYLLNHPDTGEGLVIDVNSGNTTNLGDLVYDELPLPPQ